MLEPTDPADAVHVQAMVKQRVATTLSTPGLHSSLEVAWRSGAVTLPVISMPVTSLKFNPETHRIKAQRDFDELGDAAVRNAPWSVEAQSYLGQLLSALPVDPSKTDPAFEKLEEDLRGHGQKEPGIITPSGILINGNSRCAALRRIDEPNMRVAVLPNDWSWTDLAEVELDLQMRRDYKRDYSYINLLIAIEEAISSSSAELASKAFRMQKSTLDKHLWILALLRDLSAQSKSPAGQLNLRDFETDQGKLEELHRSYFTALKSDPSGAESLKQARLLALVMNKSKTDLRWISSDFYTTFLSPRVDTVTVTAKATEATSIPGLDISVAAAQQTSAPVSELVSSMARARAAARSLNPAEYEPAQQAYDDMNDALEAAINAAGRDARLKKRKVAAIEHVTTAFDALDAGAEEIAVARSKNALDEERLNEALMQLEETFNRFTRAALRSSSAEGAGFKWLEKLQDLN
ncbi:transcriptional regulator [Frigoribacterium sp. RIT-PI-h]|uniref:transcriptional regulator n=1 Tax=Frigoribacterium sp. RIT-PI-h TaxID=1690245 RepID=UPI000AC32C73|nr:transcriptional regulator [Frigoribacterium sp. RIT-PI-h]